MPRRRSTAAAAPRRELRARGPRTMQRLLDAGVEVFAKRGYHAARVDDIVKVAKTSHGTFYLYFANKEDLFRALALDVADEMNALVASIGELSPDGAGYDMVRESLERFAELHHRFGPVIRAWTEADTDTSALGPVGTDLLGGFITALGESIAASPAAVPDPALAALAIVG